MHNMENRGILIILEGVDNIGKTATRDKLISRFEAEGIPAEGMEFPYRGFMFLRKTSKDKRATHYERFLSHCLSHSMTYPLIEEALEDGKIVILDRYWYSNLAYAPTFAGIPYDYVKDLEGVKLQPLIPDMVIYLHSSGIYPKFHKQAQIKSDKDDAFDDASKRLRGQLIRAYEYVCKEEWEGREELAFLRHNVDAYKDLESSVTELENYIQGEFVLPRFP